MKNVTKKDMGGRRCNKKGDITYSTFFFDHFFYDSIFPSLFSDGLQIISW